MTPWQLYHSSLLANFLATMPNINKLPSHKTANLTVKVQFAFDGIIMADYLPDYTDCNEAKYEPW